MKKLLTLLIIMTLAMCRASAEDYKRDINLRMPISSSRDIATGKPVGSNLIFSISVAELDGQAALVLMIYDEKTEKQYTTYAASKANATIDNTPVKKGNFTGNSETMLVLPTANQSNTVFFFKQYLEGTKSVMTRIAEFDPETNRETKVYTIKPSLDLLPDCPQGDAYYPIVEVLLRAQDKGIINKFVDITEKQ